jgi:O-antigen/teichoic acid export membrane protein
MIPILSTVGAAIAVGLYFLLIPPYSFQGAAWASAIAMTVLAVIVHAYSDRIYPVPWDWRRIALAAGLTLVLCLAALAVDAWIPTVASLPVRLGLTLAYPLVLYWARFFPPGDLAAVRSRLTHSKSRPSSS